MSDNTWRPSEEIFVNVITALASQLRVLHLDGGADLEEDWSNFSPMTPALEGAIVKCGKLDSLYLRRIKMLKEAYLAGLRVKELAIIQCYCDWERICLGGKQPRHAAPIRRRDGRKRGRSSDAPHVKASWVKCFWLSYAKKRDREAGFVQEIFGGDWPAKTSPWYLSTE